ncbi:MAG: ABC transporter permease [Nitrospinota bacterium]
MNYFGHLFKICTLVRSSSRSLMHQKLRAALSVSGIVCGIAAVFTMICIGEGARLATLKQIAELGVKNIIIKEKKLTESKKSLAIQNLSNGLTMGDVEQIKATLPSLDHVAPLKEVHASTFKAGEKFSPLILAATPDFFKIKKLSTLQGRSLQNSDRKEMKLVAVVGDEVARKLGKEGKPGGTIRIENSLFTIVGVLDTFSGRLKKKTGYFHS